jgi:hypothetical protein
MASLPLSHTLIVPLVMLWTVDLNHIVDNCKDTCDDIEFGSVHGLFPWFSWDFGTALDLVHFSRVSGQQKSRGTSVIFIGTLADAIGGALLDSDGHILSVVAGDYLRKCPLVSNIAALPSSLQVWQGGMDGAS